VRHPEHEAGHTYNGRQRDDGIVAYFAEESSSYSDVGRAESISSLSRWR